MSLHLFILGLVSILGQVALLRELGVASYGIELILILAMSVWMLGTGIGALVGKFIKSEYSHAIPLGWLAGAILFPLELLFVRSLRIIFGGVPGSFLPFGPQMLGILITALPPGLLMGLLFQQCARKSTAAGGTLASAYAIESMGSVIGGILSALLLYWNFSNLGAIIGCGLLCAGSGVKDKDKAKVKAKTRGGSFFILTLALTLAFIFCLTDLRSIDLGLTRWSHPNLVDSRDSPYGRVTITKLEGQYSIFENDALSFETEGTTAEEFAHLTALQRPAPKTVLILGGGIDGTALEILKYRPKSVVYVELNRAVIELAFKYFPDSLTTPLKSQPVSLSFSDPRRYLLGAPRFDLILVGMPEPASLQANRFYTQEFFSLCAQHLEPSGVLGFRQPSAENYWTPALLTRNASIYGALKTAFADAVVLPGTMNIFIASNASLPHDPESIISNFDALQLKTRLISPAYIRYLYTNDRFFWINRTLHETQAPVNSDDRPICFRWTVLIWLSKFFPRLFYGLDKWIVGALAVLLLSIFAVVFVSLKARSDIPRKVVSVGLAGFAGMALETALIFHYQTKCGALFRDLGLLITLFMAGLALGAAMVNRARSLKVVRIIVVGMPLAVLLIYAGLKSEVIGGLIPVGTALTFAGFFVAAVISHASRAGISEPVRIISPLYAADLIGGCIGGIVGSLWLIPEVGITLTMVGSVAVALIAGFLTLLKARAQGGAPLR